MTNPLKHVNPLLLVVVAVALWLLLSPSGGHLYTVAEEEKAYGKRIPFIPTGMSWDPISEVSNVFTRSGRGHF